jgi:methyl-accepting chemotaxis protein
MENNLEKYARQQLLFTKILCGIFALVLVCILVLTVAISGAAKQLVAVIAPLEDAVGQVEDVAAQVNNMTGQAEIIMDNMETVTQTLADADLGGMVENVNTLTTDSQSAVTEAIEKLDAIDIDTLNKAIRDLSDVVEPLAKVSNFFG